MDAFRTLAQLCEFWRLIARSAAVARFVCAFHRARQYDAVEVLKVSSLAGRLDRVAKRMTRWPEWPLAVAKKGVEKWYVVCLSKDEARLAKAVGLSLDPPSIFTRKLCKDFKC